MISTYLPQRRPSVPIASLLGLTITAEVALSYGAESFAPNLLCDLALIAVYVAASERRYNAMLAAAGLACGLAAYGAMLLPLAIGLAINRRVRPRMLLVTPLFACITIIALGTPSLAASWIGLWSATPEPAMTGLLAALALGSLAWLTATLSARPLMPDMLTAAALTCGICYALVMPGVSMAIPLALALVHRDRRISLLTGFAALTAAAGLPIPATLTLAVALGLVMKPLIGPAANDNPVLARA
ncbi:hypothetical protein VH567_03560 [Sphingomonas sp. 4RDLI-65]|uniref:hypothetical protein n=1 Tax=Sphingomonas sp. 4RDLI-65 TaxID=3111641 RepID=UPI003C1810D5